MMNCWLPNFVVATMDRVESDLSEKWSLRTMADYAGFSPHHFHRRFQEAAGETPVAFVERVRLERAALLLLASKTSITEMAWQVGYRNPETFARRFSHHFGVTARVYRQHQLALWAQLGLKAGTDPVQGPDAIVVKQVPTASIVVRRWVGDGDASEHSMNGDGTIDQHYNGNSGTNERYNVTLDYPGITDPGRVRQDWGFPLTGKTPDGWTRRQIGGGTFVQLTIPATQQVPNIIYQRLFVWSLAGRFQLRPGPVFEIRNDQQIVVHQPVTDSERE